MAKDAAVTVRLPESLKRDLQALARRERRSLSAEIVARLERETSGAPAREHRPGRLLGLYKSAVLPSAADFTRVRRLLWGGLGRPATRRAS